MSGSHFLDWIMLAVSLFNAVLLLWLGLTVLLNAEPHTWGIWLAGGGLLSGAAFFFIHSVILGLGFAYVNWTANFWWYSGWIPVILAPFAWYVLMLWYAGFWEGRRSPVYQRHRPWLWLLAALIALMIGAFLFANPLPSFGQMAHLNLGSGLALFGVPILILVYPPFILACIGLSLDTLLRPGPTMRVMGQLARRRARPWLAAASGLLLLVSLLVSGFVAWLALSGRTVTPSLGLAFAVGWLDLAISTLIGVSILLTGQAVITYEVFTDKTLPRQGLNRLWRWTVVLGAASSLALSFGVISRLPSIYLVVLCAAMLVGLLAWLGRRSYRERQEFIHALRPFLSSALPDPIQARSEMKAPSPPAQAPFKALCAEVLGARWACLTPARTLAPLFGPALVYPETAPPCSIAPDEWLRETGPDTLYLPLEGDGWGIPLWNARGLCGILLLGEKADGGLYSQEEMETARSAGERLVELQANLEISRRLADLQRRQLAESRVLDRQARRALHDDVLPRLHAVLLELSASAVAQESPQALETLAQVHHQVSDLLHDLPAPGAPEVQRLGLVGALRQALSLEFDGVFDRVNWEIAPEARARLPGLPPVQGEVLYFACREAIRNAALHARHANPDLPLELLIGVQWRDGLELTIQDNGSGVAQDDRSQAGGHGLALHSTLLAVIGGSLALSSEAGRCTRVRLWLPDWESGSPAW